METPSSMTLFRYGPLELHATVWDNVSLDDIHLNFEMLVVSHAIMAFFTS